MTTSVSAFVTNLITNIVIAAILLVVFYYLLRLAGAHFIFYSGLLLRGEKVPGWRGYLAWIQEAWDTTEDKLVSKAGLDAAIYLRLFRLGCQIFAVASLYGLVVALPVYATAGYFSSYHADHPDTTYTNFDLLTMGNMPKGSMRMWCSVVAAYWVSFTVYYFLHRSYQEVTDLRARWLGGRTATPRQYTLVVTDIPKAGGVEANGEGRAPSRSRLVDELFHALHPGNYEGSAPVPRLGKAIAAYNAKEKARRSLASAQASFEQSKRKQAPGERPKHKTGFLGLWGTKVDSIDFWTEQLLETSSTLKDEQEKALKDDTSGAALVFLNSRGITAMASQTMVAKQPQTWNVFQAPEPREIIWENADIKWWEHFVRQAVVYTIVFLAIFFFMIPVAFVSSLTTLDNLKKNLPFLRPIFNIGAISAILQAFLPQLALIVFLAVLPSLLLFLTKVEGVPTVSHQERGAAGKYYYFMVFNVFLGVSLGGAMLGQLKSMIDDPGQIPNILGSSIPQNATFFITFIMLKTFIAFALELSRVVPFIVYKVKLAFLAKTKEDHKEAWAPGPFVYYSEVPNHLLIALVGLCYSVLAPLILPFAFVYFLAGYLVLTNQALNVYVPNYESSGRMYPHIHKRVLVSLLVSQVTNLGYFGIQQFSSTVVLIPLPILTAIVYAYTSKRFEPAFRRTALEVVAQEVDELPTAEAVKAAYIPPSLVPVDVEEEIRAAMQEGAEDLEATFGRADSSPKDHLLESDGANIMVRASSA